MSLRRAQFLPSQLHAAWQIVHEQYPSIAERNDALDALFGARREFLPRVGTSRTPHPNDIATARVFRDQWQRDYSFADLSTYERDAEYTQIPLQGFTDSLFVAVPPHKVHQYREDEYSVAPETLQLPMLDERMTLFPVDKPSSPGITVQVATIVEPNSAKGHRVASGLIRIDGVISVEPAFIGRDVPTKQRIFENEIASLQR